MDVNSNLIRFEFETTNKTYISEFELPYFNISRYFKGFKNITQEYHDGVPFCQDGMSVNSFGFLNVKYMNIDVEAGAILLNEDFNVIGRIVNNKNIGKLGAHLSDGDSNLLLESMLNPSTNYSSDEEEGPKQNIRKYFRRIIRFPSALIDESNYCKKFADKNPRTYNIVKHEHDEMLYYSSDENLTNYDSEEEMEIIQDKPRNEIYDEYILVDKRPQKYVQLYLFD